MYLWNNYCECHICIFLLIGLNWDSCLYWIVLNNFPFYLVKVLWGKNFCTVLLCFYHAQCFFNIAKYLRNISNSNTEMFESQLNSIWQNWVLIFSNSIHKTSLLLFTSFGSKNCFCLRSIGQNHIRIYRLNSAWLKEDRKNTIIIIGKNKEDISMYCKDNLTKIMGITNT